MTPLQMQKLAMHAIDKRWDFEKLKYGDDLYGKEELAESVWEFVEEYDEIGRKAFVAKYKLEPTT